MKTAFFEVQDWERYALSGKFPDAELVSDLLSAKNSSEYSELEVISTFVYSALTEEVLKTFLSLKHIATRSSGFDHIDLDYCKNHGISVSNIPEYGSNTVAEHTFALILSLTRKIYKSVDQVKNLNFEHKELTGIDIHGKTLGIVGLGKIGINVLRIANSFGMKVIVHTTLEDENLKKKFNFEYTDLGELLRKSDIVTLHVPLSPDTKHMINKENITSFKKGSYLINTARGGLIETEAILLGLSNGILEGVGLDVLENERELNEEISVLTSPNHATDLKNVMMNHVLINHPKVLITPHNAFNSKEALSRITETTIQNVEGFLKGHPINIVSQNA